MKRPVQDHDALTSSGKFNLVDAYKRHPWAVIQLRNTTPVWNMGKAQIELYDQWYDVWIMMLKGILAR